MSSLDSKIHENNHKDNSRTKKKMIQGITVSFVISGSASAKMMGIAIPGASFDMSDLEINFPLILAGVL